MVSRATSFLCCFLTVWSPTIGIVQVIEHAHEHMEAMLTGHGHAHHNGQVPHHEHEENGTPIRADEPIAIVRAATPTISGMDLQSAAPASFLTYMSDIVALQRVRLGCLCYTKHIPPPRTPTPGDTLPLLI